MSVAPSLDSIGLGLALAVSGLLVTSATAEPAPRRGVTVEAGAGLALVAVAGDGPGGGLVGVAAPGLSVGGFLSPRWAFALRATGAIGLDADAAVGAWFLGPTLQAFVVERAFVGAGVGAAVIYEHDSSGHHSAPSVGLDLRLGYVVRRDRSSSWNVSLEANVASVGGAVATLGLSLGKQWH